MKQTLINFLRDESGFNSVAREFDRLAVKTYQEYRNNPHEREQHIRIAICFAAAYLAIC